MAPGFSLAIKIKDGTTVYYEKIPAMPVPRVGEDVFTPHPALGWWTVKEVYWHVPQKDAMTPTMACFLTVEWSRINNTPAPVYGENGWERPNK